MPYVLLGAAILSEVFASSMMKLSDGFKHKLPAVGMAVGYLLAFYLMALALEHLALGFAYAAWTGVGIVLTAIAGAVFWHEGFNMKKALGLIAIIAGVVVLKLGV